MTIKVLVNGAFGRMGLATVNAIKACDDFELVGEIGRDYDLKKSIADSKADVVVDFTLAEVVYQNTQTIIEAGAHPVIGTSGLKAEEIKTLQQLAAEKKLGGIIAPNFSLGAVLMMKSAKEIARYLPNVEIIEMHHEDKADSPSGTAMRTAQLLADANANLNAAHKAMHETVKGARGATYRNIPIHAVRLPGFLAHQEIIFGESGETLTLRHDSIDRQCFMPGVLLACRKVMELNQLVYGLEEIL